MRLTSVRKWSVFLLEKFGTAYYRSCVSDSKWDTVNACFITWIPIIAGARRTDRGRVTPTTASAITDSGFTSKFLAKLKLELEQKTTIYFGTRVLLITRD